MTESRTPDERSTGARPLPPELNELYRTHLDDVWNGLRRLGVPASDVEDLAQEVFLRAFRDWHRYDRSRPVGAWLFGIAYHVAIDFLRLERHARELGAERLPEVPSNERPPDERVASGQARRQLFALLDQLDLDRRAVIVMHELLGHTVPEIAAALEIPLNTAYSRLRLARASLAALVRKQNPEQGVA